MASGSRGHASDSVADDELRLTRAQTRELDRRIRDLRDRTRYLLVSSFSPQLALYYNVSRDTYGMNAPTHATLFKRRAAAQAIGQMLGCRIVMAACRIDGRGRLVLSSLRVHRRSSQQANRKGRS